MLLQGDHAGAGPVAGWLAGEPYCCPEPLVPALLGPHGLARMRAQRHRLPMRLIP